MFVCLFWPTNALAVTYDQYAIFNESYPSGDHKFVVNEITSYTLTEWYLNGVKQEEDESTWLNGYWDPSYSIIFSPGGRYVIKAYLYNSSGENTTIYTWTADVRPADPSTVSVKDITEQSASIYGYGVTGADYYSVSYRINGTSSWTHKAQQSATTSLAGLNSDTSYDIRILACNNTAGCSDEYIETNVFSTKSICSYSVSNLSDTEMSYSGDSGSTKITGSPSGCVGSWTSSESSSWITLSGDGSGSSSGTWTLSYSVSKNTSQSSRTASVSVAGKTLQLGQLGAPACSYDISPTSASNISYNGTNGNITITGSPVDCTGTWGSTEGLSWVSNSGEKAGSGAGSWTLIYDVEENSALTARSGFMNIAGTTFNLSQNAAPNTEPTKPGTISFTNLTKTSVRVHWGASEDAQDQEITYTVQYKTDHALSWQNAGSTINTYRDISGLSADTTYDVKITPYDGLTYGPARDQENVFSTLPDATIESSYWQANSDGNTDFNEGAIAKATVKLEGVSANTSVRFDIYEYDYGLSCSGELLATVEGQSGGVESDGYSYATIEWKTNTFLGLFEDTIFRSYPERNEFCFKASIVSLEDSSSGLIYVFPREHELDFFVRHSDGINRLIIGAYDATGLNLAANLPITVTAGGQTYNLTTGDDGSIWKGLLDLVWFDGYYGAPGYAYVNNVNLSYPADITVSFAGNSKFAPVTKTVTVDRSKKLDIGSTVTLLFGGSTYTISNLSFDSAAQIQSWTVRDVDGRCIIDEITLASLAIYLENLEMFSMYEDTDPNLSQLLVHKKVVDMVNDSSRDMSITGTVMGIALNAGNAYLNLSAETIKEGGKAILKEVAIKVGQDIANTFTDIPLTTLGLIENYQSSQRAILLAYNLLAIGDKSVTLKKTMLDYISDQLMSGNVIDIEYIEQVLQLDYSAQRWLDKSFELSSYLNDISEDDFNSLDVWWDWASNIIPFGSTATYFWNSGDASEFTNSIAEILGLRTNDAIWEDVDSELNALFSAEVIADTITRLSNAGILGQCINQTITFDIYPSSLEQGESGALVATTDSGLTVEFSSNTSSVCNVSEQTVTGVTPGNCKVAANQSGDSSYNPAQEVIANIAITTIAKENQTITFDTFPESLMVGGSGVLGATVDSPLTVSFTSNTPSICSVTGQTVNAVTSGTCKVAAIQEGDSEYNPAVEVYHDILVADKNGQSITFETYPSSLNVGENGSLIASASSGLQVSLTSKTGSICSVDGNVVTAIAGGSCIVAANQVGNDTYHAAREVTRSISVKDDQTITFSSCPSVLQTGDSGGLVASASSGLLVSYSSKTVSLCSVSGNIVTALSNGSCIVAANQVGNDEYDAAPEETRSIIIGGGTDQTIIFHTYPSDLIVGETGVLGATASSGLTVEFVTETEDICSVNGTTVTALSAGTCLIVASQMGDDIYNPAPDITKEIFISEPEVQILPGDINGDEIIDLKDLLSSLHLLSGTSSTESIITEADINGDSRLGVEEAIYILRETAGLLQTVTSQTGKVWMDRNLGASRVAMSSSDSEAFGDLYQWGRDTDGHEVRASRKTSIKSTSDDPGHDKFILDNDNTSFDWRTPQNNDLWQVENALNNPCPSGFRIPTKAEWETEMAFWDTTDKNAAFNSRLKLPAAGLRQRSDGTVIYEGNDGYYWSSTVEGLGVDALNIYETGANIHELGRSFGASVRCIQE